MKPIQISFEFTIWLFSESTASEMDFLQVEPSPTPLVFLEDDILHHGNDQRNYFRLHHTKSQVIETIISPGFHTLPITPDPYLPYTGITKR